MPASPKSTPNASRSRRKSAGVVIPHQPTWYQRVAAWLIFTAIRTASATLRYRWNDRSEFFNGTPPGPAIYCVWHNRLCLCLVAYHAYAKKRSATSGIARRASRLSHSKGRIG